MLKQRPIVYLGLLVASVGRVATGVSVNPTDRTSHRHPSPKR